jgi:hypothetical protein
MPKGRVNFVLLVLFMVSAAVNAALWRSGLARPERVVDAVADGRTGMAGIRSPAGAGRGVATSDATARLAFLSSIEDEHLRRAREISDSWWSGHGEYEAAYADALSEGLAAIRDELSNRFGPDVENDPAFRWLFRPLDPLYWFLSSDEQLAIQKLRRERDRALQAAVRDAGRPVAGPGLAGASPAGPAGIDQAATLAIVQEYQAGLAALLDADTLLELELRDSAIAQQLRASGVELTESEFRDAYTLMAALQRESADPIDGVAIRERLRGLLGIQRFAALWAARDPMFAEIAAIAGRHTLPEATASSVYELLTEFQDRRLALARAAGGNTDRAARDALALANDERAALARLVGEEVADEIVRGRARVSYWLFGGSRPPDFSDSRESQGGRFR